MTLERKIAGLFKLTNENWMKHANPWSVWTRYSVLPIIVLAFWSRVWIGWWYLVPAIISLAWMFLNPVFFGRAKSTKNWASKAVLGERVWMNRDKIDIPEYHKKLPLLDILTDCVGHVVKRNTRLDGEVEQTLSLPETMLCFAWQMTVSNASLVIKTA